MTKLPARIAKQSAGCPQCGKLLVRRPMEKPHEFAERMHCDRVCAMKARANYASLHEMLLNNSFVAPSGCWEWLLHRDPSGYGRASVRFGDEVLAHRLSYIEFKGPIEDGLCILHSCDNPCCINPEHLRAGTNAENVKDRVRRHRSARQWGSANPNFIHGQFSRLDRCRAANDR